MKEQHPTMYFHCRSEEDNKTVRRYIEKIGVAVKYEPNYPTCWHIEGVVFFDYKEGEGI